MSDTRAVTRWEYYDGAHTRHSEGPFVRFKDHERVVGELEKDRNEWKQLADSHVEVIRELRSALAASSAEVEGLKSILMDAIDYRFISDKEFRKVTVAAIDAAMEKGNV